MSEDLLKCLGMPDGEPHVSSLDSGPEKLQRARIGKRDDMPVNNERGLIESVEECTFD
jgi:hypothetical protein